MKRQYECADFEVQLIRAEGGLALSSESFQTGKNPESIPDIQVWDLQEDSFDIEL